VTAAEGLSRDTPEIASLRLVCAHPCAQTVPRKALGRRHATDAACQLDGALPFARWWNERGGAAPLRLDTLNARPHQQAPRL